MQALGGAKNHMLVLPDADLDMAADAAVSAGLRLGRRALHGDQRRARLEAIADELVAKIAERIPSIKVGPGNEPDNEMGPLITGEHRDKVRGYVDGAASDGATIVVDGRDEVPGRGLLPQADAARQRRCRARRPTTTRSSAGARVVRVHDYDEALHLINDNPYGNGVAIFTRDGGAARQFEFDVNVGMVGVNVPIPVPVSYYSFGGWKSSLFGDTHMYGPEGINFYTRGKVVTSRWPDPARAPSTSASPRTDDW